MTFLCSKNNSVKEQRPHVRSAAPVTADTRGRQRDAKASATKRSASAPLTVTEQHKHELRQRRMRELENYPYPKRGGKGVASKSSNALNSARSCGSRKEGAGGFFSRMISSKRQAAAAGGAQGGDRGEDCDGTSLLGRGAGGRVDDDCSLKTSCTLIVDDFTFLEPGEKGEEHELHVVVPQLGIRDSCATLSSMEHASTQNSNSNDSVNTRKIVSTGRSSLARTPPPACIPEWQGYFMYERVDEETQQKMRVRSNRPPPRSKSLERVRPAPLRAPGY